MTVLRSPGPGAFLRAGFAAREFFPHDVVLLRKQQRGFLRDLKLRRFPKRGLILANFRQLSLCSRDQASSPNPPSWQLGSLIADLGLYLDGEGSLFIGTVRTCLRGDADRPEAPAGHARHSVVVPPASHKILLNAALVAASANNCRFAYCPASPPAHEGGDVTPESARRINEWVSEKYACTLAEIHGFPYWRIMISENRRRIASLAAMPWEMQPPDRPVICIFHDVEEDVDTPVSRERCQEALRRMLQTEEAAGVSATYNILGTLYREKAPVVAAAGRHSIAFHSYDHRIPALSQLPRVRDISPDVRGYRPPQSRLTPELTDYALSYYNFEWLMSSAGSLRRTTVGVEQGIVKIPVHFDDYPLYRRAITLESWIAVVLQHTERNSFTAIGLHDCYADFWMDSYPFLLDHLRRAGVLWTGDQICDAAFLQDPVSPEFADRVPSGESGRRLRESGIRSPQTPVPIFSTRRIPCEV